MLSASLNKTFLSLSTNIIFPYPVSRIMYGIMVWTMVFTFIISVYEFYPLSYCNINTTTNNIVLVIYGMHFIGNGCNEICNVSLI